MPSPYLGQPFVADDATTIDGAYHVVRLDDDGLRRVIDHGGIHSGQIWNEIVAIFRDPWGDSPAEVWGPSNEGPEGLFNALSRAKTNGWYLPYAPAPDAVALFPTEEPVNQYPQLLEFREHAARFAHQLDDALGHHSLTSASEEDRMVTFQTLSSMIGSGWSRYKIWDAIDPEELVAGGNFVGVPLWKRHREEYVEIDRLMCGQCDIATFARRFLFQANLPLFRRLYRSGIIYVANRSTTPWESTLFAVASDPVSTFYNNLETEYHQALLYYDEVVGASDT